MRRRTFIGLGVIGAAGGAAGYLALRSSPAAPKLEGPLAQRLRRKFPDLSFGDDVVAAFERDLAARKRLTPRGLDEYRRFLLSTDFFLHGGDTNRALKYVALYDPYRSPCWNPLIIREDDG